METITNIVNFLLADGWALQAKTQENQRYSYFLAPTHIDLSQTLEIAVYGIYGEYDKLKSLNDHDYLKYLFNTICEIYEGIYTKQQLTTKIFNKMANKAYFQLKINTGNVNNLIEFKERLCNPDTGMFCFENLFPTEINVKNTDEQMSNLDKYGTKYQPIVTATNYSLEGGVIIRFYNWVNFPRKTIERIIKLFPQFEYECIGVCEYCDWGVLYEHNPAKISVEHFENSEPEHENILNVLKIALLPLNI